MKFNFKDTVKTAFTFALVFYIFNEFLKLLDVIFIVTYGGK